MPSASDRSHSDTHKFDRPPGVPLYALLQYILYPMAMLTPGRGETLTDPPCPLSQAAYPLPAHVFLHAPCRRRTPCHPLERLPLSRPMPFSYHARFRLHRPSLHVSRSTLLLHAVVLMPRPAAWFYYKM